MIFLFLPIFLPLFLKIGRNFEYEYWFLVTQFLGLIILPLAIHYNQKAFKFGTKVLEKPLSIFLIVIAILGASFALKNLTDCPCGDGEYFFWFLAQFLPSYFGFIILYLLIRAFPRLFLSKSKLFGVLLYLGTLLIPLALIWINPQKRILSSFIGFIHGPIYDEWIPFSDSFIIFRLFQLGIFLALLFFLFWKTSKRKLVYLVGFSLLLIAANIFEIKFPETGNTAKSLNRLLDEQVKSNDLILHYKKSQNPEKQKNYLDRFIIEANFHTEELKKEFQLMKIKPIHIYLYPDVESKKNWFGGHYTDITDVVTPSIHITPTRGLHSTLRHELVHAISTNFSYHNIGFHPNMMLTEGLAEVYAPRYGRDPIDVQSAAILRNKIIANVEDLFGPLFWTHSGRSAYTLSGSLLHFIKRNYGAEALKKIYSGVGFKSALNMDFKKLISLWQESILAKHNPKKDLKIKNRFSYRGVWKNICSHTKATYQRKLSEEASLYLRQPKGYSFSEKYLPFLNTLNPNNPKIKSQIIRHSLKNEILQKNRLDIPKHIKNIGSLINIPPRSYSDINLLIFSIELQLLNDNVQLGSEIMESLNSFSNNIEFSNASKRHLSILKYILSLPKALRISWIKYFCTQNIKFLQIDSLNGSFYYHYLHSRYFSSTIKTKEIEQLVNLSIPKSLTYPILREWNSMLLKIALNHNNMELAEKILVRWRKSTSEKDQYFIKSTDRFIQYYKNYVNSSS